MRNLLKSSRDLTRFIRFVKVLAWKIRRISQIAEYLSSDSVKKLQVGSGANLLSGWLNSDYIPGPGRIHLDASEQYPFPDNCFDYIYCEHTIEHIHYRQALVMLQQCNRVLKPGGRIRITTPNLEIYAGFLKSNPSPIERDCIEYFFDNWIKTGFHAAKDYQPVTDRPSAVFVLNDIFRNYEHRFIYDYRTLADLLGAAEFKSIERAVSGLSSDPTLSGLETHSDPINSFITLIVEAQKKSSDEPSTNN